MVGGADSHKETIFIAGWLLKEGRIRRRRFFVLSKKGLNYYRTEDTSEPPAGTVHLNW